MVGTQPGTTTQGAYPTSYGSAQQPNQVAPAGSYGQHTGYGAAAPVPGIAAMPPATATGYGTQQAQAGAYGQQSTAQYGQQSTTAYGAQTGSAGGYGTIQQASAAGYGAQQAAASSYGAQQVRGATHLDMIEVLYNLL